MVSLSSFVLLIGLFYYGYQYLVQPLKTEAELVSENYTHQERVLRDYPAKEELLKEYEETYEETKTFLPLDVQANKALISLKTYANKAGVFISSFLKTTEEEGLEGSGHFAKVNYSAQLSAANPNQIEELFDQLIKEERVWKIQSFSYNKAGEENYQATADFELYYRKAD